ncbi:MAG: lamin tail domain-containing protein [Bacteroidia bacterium]|nr:lamin tail domain-containing protein [Bacteroidia bacterium]
MKIDKLLILTILFLGNISVSFGQIAAWDFSGVTTAIPTFAATTFDANLSSSNLITRGAGATASSAVNSFRTTGFKNEGISTANTDYFQITISPAIGYNLSLSTIDAKFGGTASYYAAPGVTSQFAYSLDGTNFTLIGLPDQTTNLTMAQIDLTSISALQNVNSGTTVTIRYYASGQTTTGGWGFLSGASPGTNGLAIGGSITVANPNNNDSYIQNPVTQIGAANISSLVTTLAQAVPVFKVSVNDAGTSDGLPTNITQITLKNANPVNSADWQTAIQGIKLLNGINTVNVQQVVISANAIVLTINSGDLVIPNAGSADLTFEVYLNQSGLIDGTQFQFFVNHLVHGWGSDMSGSGFLPVFVSDVTSAVFTIDVVGSKLQFTSVPTSVWANQNFNISVEATDINNNLDLSANNQIVLQKNIGGGVLSSVTGLTQTLSSGVYNWIDVKYDSPGYFSLLINEQSSTLSQATTGLINCIPTGQILNESFNDGDFTNSPSWTGETGDMIITPELQLQLFTTTTTTDTSYLVTPLWLSLDSIEWQVYIKLGFDPSDNNFTRYYLMSDNENLKSSLNGYFLKFGENGTNDAVQLFYQSGSTITSVCRAIDGQIASSPSVRVKVIRTNAGLWRLYVDPTGGSSFELQAQGSETSFLSNGFYTGVFNRYTSTNASGKFTFDDFYCGPVQVDTIAPTFTDLSVIDSLHLDLHFSEGISLSTAQAVLNFAVNSGIGNPISAIRDALDYKVIHLTFSTPFISGTTYTLTASNLKDFSNNSIAVPVVETFMWYKALPFDIQINEIMADPSPVIGLPEFEYLELHNRSIYDIDISNWSLTIGTSTVVIPSSKILADGYLIICTSTAQTALQAYGNTLGIISSSSALTNTGNSIVLKDKEDQTISFVQYSDSWYRSTFKVNGGWSIEQIDPMNPCGENTNWIASVDPSGGTPGRRNSVFATNSDLIAPELLRAVLTLPDTLLLTFGETIFANDTLNVSDFSVNHGIGSPVTAVFTDITKKKAKLIFSQTFLNDTVYEISVIGQLKDCAGNLITTSNKALFAIPDTIIPGCLVINEVLFNPNTGGVDYVELYNNTKNVFDLKDLKLAVLDITGQPSVIDDIAPEGFYMFPGYYAVLTTDPTKVFPFYSCPNKKAFVKMQSMPSYNNSDGRVSIINKSFQVIDDFSYTESMHFQLLNSFQGVSLERIHPDIPTQDAKNWHSAAESAGFGTPGYKNSQFSQFEQLDASITVEPEVFSPDNDGYNDLLNIRYKFEEPGYVANVTIFDARGRKVKLLVSNELLAIEGYFTWDGLNDANQKVALGVYVVFVEVFNLNGNTKHFKKACVVASKL